MPRRRPQDHFGERARKEGYPARSIYKLQQIDQRLRLFRSGQRVLDLGAAPGSWSLYAAERVGPSGRVVGIDRQAIEIGAPPQVRFLQLDVEAVSRESLQRELAATTAPGARPFWQGELGFELVLSDMAPHTSGQRHRDQYLSFELYMQALRVAEALLLPGGHFVGKLFHGPELQEARAASTRLLGQVRLVKPEASRSESYEIYLVGGPRPG
jgi:23S rRNA (uridine2552-2'-O)-methyltransferase